MKNDNVIIKVSRRARPCWSNASVVINVQSQNDDWARDNLLYTDSWDADNAMVFPRSVAELLVRRWTYSPNRATPAFYIQSI